MNNFGDNDCFFLLSPVRSSVECHKQDKIWIKKTAPKGTKILSNMSRFKVLFLFHF